LTHSNEAIDPIKVRVSSATLQAEKLNVASRLRLSFDGPGQELPIQALEIRQLMFIPSAGQ
jgi:hypothetical protein